MAAKNTPPAASTGDLVRIKLTTSLAGIRVSFKPGDEIEVHAAEAKRHVDCGNAVYAQVAAAE